MKPLLFHIVSRGLIKDVERGMVDPNMHLPRDASATSQESINALVDQIGQYQAITRSVAVGLVVRFVIYGSCSIPARAEQCTRFMDMLGEYSEVRNGRPGPPARP